MTNEKWEENGNTTRLNLGVGVNHWEWERMGLKRHSSSSLHHTSGLHKQPINLIWC